jgi:hypothetical protein
VPAEAAAAAARPTSDLSGQGNLHRRVSLRTRGAPATYGRRIWVNTATDLAGASVNISKDFSAEVSAQ